ncbi:MAG TPA: carboxypeptidase-like regulatory domain-containing protein, partial [Chitinophagaceae bacterium]|nr:carboxypeptidase-like regulatory domain-containing protein [Chitinophagaceae bacterium]
MKRKLLLFFFTLFTVASGFAQQGLHGEVRNEHTGETIPGATISISDSSNSVIADNQGKFSILVPAGLSLRITAAGYETKIIYPGSKDNISVSLVPVQKELDAVVITGTMKAVKRSESPVAVEVYTPQFFKKNPSPSIFESLQNVNGVRPQLNCSVCNTG